MADQPNQSRPQNPTSPTLMHTQVRLVEISSRYTYNWNEASGEWDLTSGDQMSATAKFNQWAEKNNVNPVSFSLVPVHQHSNGGKTLTVIHPLCASVVGRAEQAQMELAYREQTAKLMSVLTPPVAAPQVTPVPVPQSADAGTVPPPPSPPSALTPVNVNALAEGAPSPPPAVSPVQVAPVTPGGGNV